MEGMSFTEWFVVVVMATIIVMYARRYYGEVEFIQSKVDGRSYLVRQLPDSQRAADTLARLNTTLTALIQHMVAKYPTDKEVAQLSQNYDPDALSEGGAEVGYTSYSVNKGERVVMCLRHQDGAFVDENVLVYVAVHELGHLMTADIGHTERFWANFKWLLEEAISQGLYKRVDYGASPQPYCGITITSSVV